MNDQLHFIAYHVHHILRILHIRRMAGDSRARNCVRNYVRNCVRSIGCRDNLHNRRNRVLRILISIANEMLTWRRV